MKIIEGARRIAKARGGLLFQPQEELFLTRDELLVVRMQFYHERHMRFRLAQVCGFTTVATTAYRNSALVALAAIFLYTLLIYYLMMLMGWESAIEGLPFLIIPLVALVIWLAVHLWLGPTCRVLLYTAASATPLLSLRRRRKASRILGQLEAIIRESQRREPSDAAPEAARAPDSPKIAYTTGHEGTPAPRYTDKEG